MKTRTGVLLAGLVALVLMAPPPAQGQLFKKARESIHNAQQKAQQKANDTREKWQQKAHDTQERLQQKARDTQQQFQQQRQNLQQRAQNAQQQFQDRRQQFTNQAHQQLQRFSGPQAQSIHQGLDRVIKQYGEQRASQLVGSLQRLNTHQAELLTKCYEKYGQQQAVAQRMLNNVMAQPEAYRARILQAYNEHSADIGDRVSACYNQYARSAPQFAEKLSGLYLQSKQEMAERIHHLALSQRIDDAKVILTYYAQTQNQKVASQLCEFSRRAGDRFREDMRNITERVVIEMRDPQNQERAIACAMGAIEVYTHRKEYSTVAIKTVLQKVPVRTPDGRVITAEDLVKQQIVRTCPYLAGTTIAEDPVRCLTYGVLFRDNDFLFNDLKVIPGPQGARSANEALCAAIKADPGQAEAAFAQIEAWSVITSPDANPEEMAGAVSVLMQNAPTEEAGV